MLRIRSIWTCIKNLCKDNLLRLIGITKMSVVDDKFRKVRCDQTPYLFHFMSGTPEEAKYKLSAVLKEEQLLGKNGYICFTASPITALFDFFKTSKFNDGQPMYQPYGIGFSRDLLIGEYGARNVFYGSNEEISLMPRELKWRSLLLEIGKYDFEYLREWRVRGDNFNFTDFPRDEMIIIAPTEKDLNDLVVFHDVKFCPVINYETGDVDPDFEEVFFRAFKGMTIVEATKMKNDYEVSESVKTQDIGEDMFDRLILSHFFWVKDSCV